MAAQAFRVGGIARVAHSRLPFGQIAGRGDVPSRRLLLRLRSGSSGSIPRSRIATASRSRSASAAAAAASAALRRATASLAFSFAIRQSMVATSSSGESMSSRSELRIVILGVRRLLIGSRQNTVHPRPVGIPVAYPACRASGGTSIVTGSKAAAVRRLPPLRRREEPVPLEKCCLGLVERRVVLPWRQPGEVAVATGRRNKSPAGSSGPTRRIRTCRYRTRRFT